MRSGGMLRRPRETSTTSEQRLLQLIPHTVKKVRSQRPMKVKPLRAIPSGAAQPIEDPTKIEDDLLIRAKTKRVPKLIRRHELISSKLVFQFLEKLVKGNWESFDLREPFAICDLMSIHHLEGGMILFMGYNLSENVVPLASAQASSVAQADILVTTVDREASSCTEESDTEIVFEEKWTSQKNKEHQAPDHPEAQPHIEKHVTEQTEEKSAPEAQADQTVNPSALAIVSLIVTSKCWRSGGSGSRSRGAAEDLKFGPENGQYIV
ncbi:hypothetical protein F511_37810 [Dorcoceras hygrometricum]|uniref:Uncharacterized protein n=1 Tax=Dorcoceras hygrometricum TaxID=472368 RepID=A0A2Z7B445_9LAMI|nr:hypothetical protein F511_37810 [Dorcoceras hygrometricum]